MLPVRMRELRERNEYSQQDIADMLGVDPQQYYRWEAGKNEPKSSVVIKLAHIYGVTTDYLYGKEDKMVEEITEADLSPIERALIVAYRRRRIWDLIGFISELAPESARSLQRIVGDSDSNEGKQE
jgi:transcriptional regulator with XRE-family HTH domain